MALTRTERKEVESMVIHQVQTIMIWILQQSTFSEKPCVKHTFGQSFFLKEVLRGSDFGINASYFQDLFSQAHRVVPEFRLKLKVLYMSHHEAWKQMRFCLRSNDACKPLADHSSVLCNAFVSNK